MSKAIVNTFKKLDTDTSQNKQDPSSFYDAQDLRLISDEPLSNGALVNYKGTKAKIDLGSPLNKVVGYAEVGSELVLLSSTIPIYSVEKNINVSNYGNLYNWYAATDSRNISPVGWHVPSKTEIDTLISYLIANGYNYDGTTTGNKIGKSLANGTDWKEYSIIGTIGYSQSTNNSTGFNLKPGGYYHSSSIVNIGSYSGLWTSTEYNTITAYGASGTHSSGDFSTYSGIRKDEGFNIRCIRDNGNINTSVTDIDGNIYESITIGTQTWLSTDLKTTKYRNGESIGNDFSGTSGAFKSYDNSIYTITIGGVLINSITNYISSVSLSEDNSLQSPTLLYSTGNNGLGFAEVDYVETIGRYENEFSKKIYFAVQNQPLRVFNIYYSDISLLPNTSAPSNLDIIPNNSGSTISIDSIVQGGKLETGKIQYACRLFNKYGAETTFSSCSELISLTSDNYSNSGEFKGSDIELNSGKSVRINISLPSLDFNYIHIYSIHYKVKDTPVISLVGEFAVVSDTFSFIDNGTILDSVTLEEFNIFGGSLISAETIGTKNNILFAANTKEISDTMDLDCRAYRYAAPITRTSETVNVISWNSTEIVISYNHSSDRSTRIKLDLPGDVAIKYYRIKSINYGGNQLTFYHNNEVQQGSTIDIISDLFCESYLYNSDNSYYILYSDGEWSYISNVGSFINSGSNWSIPLTSDCINKYNNEFEKTSGNSIHPYIYDKNIVGEYGGTGKIVSYEIKTGDSVTLIDNGETIVNSSNINFILKETSFKQGEVYRFGLTVYDLKGKPYFTNWIGDIRIPYFNDSDKLFSNSVINPGSGLGNVTCTAKNIYIEFSINTANITDLSKISGFQISRVERNQYDRSIVSQGSTLGGVIYIPGLSSYISTSLTRQTLTDLNSPEIQVGYNKLNTLISPELNINGGIQLSEFNYRAYICNIYKGYTHIYNDGQNWSGNYSVSNPGSNMACWKIFPNINNDSYEITAPTAGISQVRGTSFTLDKLHNLSSENNSQSVSMPSGVLSYTYTNKAVSNYTNGAYNAGIIGHLMYNPTMVIFSSEYNLETKNGSDNITYIIDIYVDNANTRYGGNTYSSRGLNEYQAASKFYPKDNVSAIKSYGDTYNTVFDTLTSIVDISQDDLTTGDTISGDNEIDRRQVVALIPLESSVNCALTGNKPSKYILTYPSGRNIDSKYIGLAETELKGINMYGGRYPKIGDFNSYNTVYSSTPKYPTFFPKPNIFDVSTEKNNFIYASEKKINGEYVDSWSKFLYANSLEVEGIYGAIHKLTTLDNKLYFFQEGAIGVAAVNDRYIIGAGDAAKLSLGTGGVLERFDYVKYNEGIIKPEHVINTVTNLYFIDHNRKVIDIIGNSDIALSIEKGINTLFRYLYKDSSTYVTIGFDPVFREVYFNINNGTDKTNKTLVYNENINTFQPRSSATPDLFLSISDGLLSFKQSNNIPNIKNYIYKHNAGDIGELYSESLSIYSVDTVFVVDGGGSAPYTPTEVIDGGSSSTTSSEIIDGGLSNVPKNYEPSFVSILVNTNSTGVFVADNVEFRTEVRDYNSDNSMFNDIATFETDINNVTTGTHGDDLKTVSSIEFKNSYQLVNQTTIVKQDNDNGPFTPSTYPNTSRRHRSWTTQVPMPKDRITKNSTRFVDTFLSMKFTFNNRDNKVFKLHDIITYIRPAHK
jgi:uncharacterized protein (TIGR02145 family)